MTLHHHSMKLPERDFSRVLILFLLAAVLAAFIAATVAPNSKTNYLRPPGYDAPWVPFS